MTTTERQIKQKNKLKLCRQDKCLLSSVKLSEKRWETM